MFGISVIVPTYNRARLIARTIESVINQTSQDWELIVVDDGSTDDTASVVGKYVSEKIKYLSQPNGGANKARNVGARHATYPYLTFLDSDDELFPDWVESFQQTLNEHVQVVCCGTYRIEPQKEQEVLPKSLGKIFDDAVGKFTNGASYVISKKLFVGIGGFDEELASGQHTELSFRLADKIRSKEITIVNIFRPLVKIYIHDGPRIRTNIDSKFKGAFRIFKKHGALLSREPQLKRNYARIISFQALQKRYFWLAFRAFIVFCKYSILAKLR